MLDTLEALEERFAGLLYFNVDSVLAAPVAGPDYKIAGKRRRAMINRAREFGDRVRHACAGTGGELGILRWVLLAPTYGDVIGALADGDPNGASGIVHISANGNDVVVGGDAPLNLWEKAASTLPTHAIVRWPHHGGEIGGTSREEAQRRLFELTDPVRVVVSVGASNGNDHPFEAFFEARRAHGAKLMCTEVTERCLRQVGQAGPCAGTIRVDIDESSVEMSTDDADFELKIASFKAAQCLDVPVRHAQ
jgi:hypothetical protein